LSRLDRYAVARTPEGNLYISAEEYPRLKEHLLNGSAFYEGCDNNGEELVLRLERVDSIHLRTPEGLARSQEKSPDDAQSLERCDIVTKPGTMCS
jgi:hypothetical protein